MRHRRAIQLGNPTKVGYRLCGSLKKINGGILSYIPVLERRTIRTGKETTEEWTGRVMRTKEIRVREEDVVIPDGYLPFRLQGSNQEEVELQISKKLTKLERIIQGNT